MQLSVVCSDLGHWAESSQRVSFPVSVQERCFVSIVPPGPLQLLGVDTQITGTSFNTLSQSSAPHYQMTAALTVTFYGYRRSPSSNEYR